MTRFEYEAVMNAISVCEEEEKKLCVKFCELIPQNRERIEHATDIMLLAYMRARHELGKLERLVEE